MHSANVSSVDEEDLTSAEIRLLQSKLVSPITHPANVELLRGLSRRQREIFARTTKTMVLYLGEEVSQTRSAEEQAALAALPVGHPIELLQGLNLGCGDRLITPYALPIDIMRSTTLDPGSGVHTHLSASAFLANPADLPFKSNSVDFIIALHLLEHIGNPVATVLHWLDVLKPGGGLGIILPDWRFTWDSRTDDAPFGHKWNPTPSLLSDLHARYWSDRADLEACDTYDWAISFDIILRKHGLFVPFQPPCLEEAFSGHARYVAGNFLHGD